MEPLRIAVAGGVPAPLGGGGLETQKRETMAALERAGHEVFDVATETSPRAFDLLHTFSLEADVCQWLTHWRRNPAPLSVAPVLVLGPDSVRRERLVVRLPLPSFAPRARALALRRSDVAVALTEHEAGVLRLLGARNVVVIPNGVRAVDEVPAPDGLPDGYVLLLGTVSARKRQAETLEALDGVPAVVVGGFDGTPAERAAFEATVARTGATWLGEIRDAAAVRALLRDARALVHLSKAEGQPLAILEALAAGTPVVVSALAANRELAAAHPAHVRLVEDGSGVADAVRGLGAKPATAPRIMSWDDVAAALLEAWEPLARGPRPAAN